MPRAPSLETILTYEQKEHVSDNWSVVWSTDNIPAMDNATGAGRATRRARGRRRLRYGSLALGSFLTMHCRVAASAITDGFFLFMVFLVAAVALLANPMRHFEVYLGQWSISGPGRAFRIIPMLDGIGIAICINAIVRTIYCVSIAAIAGVYVTYSASCDPLPFTYCRHLDLTPYEPTLKPVKVVALEDKFTMLEDEMSDEGVDTLEAAHQAFRRSANASHVGDLNFIQLTPCNLTLKSDKTVALGPSKLSMIEDDFNVDRIDRIQIKEVSETIESAHRAFKRFANVSRPPNLAPLDGDIVHIQVCQEKFYGAYPPLYSSPAYNFFFVEVIRFRDSIRFDHYNMRFLVCNVVIWIVIWWLMIQERLTYGRLIWNNVYSWFAYLPWVWALILVTVAVIHLGELNQVLVKVFRVGTKEFLWGIADALEVALYVHAASLGTELIHGKGLNYYASGHIDPLLNGESVWHSGMLLLLCCLTSSGAAICAVVDYIHPENKHAPRDMHESKLWLIPMYSQCMVIGNYSHFATMLIFGGLVLAHIIPAFIILKTALHIIFEYRVKLVFIEQLIVAAIVLLCMGISLFICISGGLAILEGIDALMTGVAMPFICFMELLGLVWVYRSPDFLSDIDVATEDNACASRIGIQWQIIPIVCLFIVVVKVISLVHAEMPSPLMWLGTLPLLAVLLAVPLRAAVNAYSFLKPTPRRGT